MSTDKIERITVEAGMPEERLDVYLARCLADRFSRTKIKKLIEEGKIRIQGAQVAAHRLIREGEVIELDPVLHQPEDTRAENIPIKILHEDEDLLVVDKPAGLVVHPAHGNPDHTLVNALLYHTNHLSGAGGPIRPGIVHRLDKETSGVMVVAKNDRAHASLGNQFKNHTIVRMYLAAVKGVVQHDEGLCEEPVGRAFLNRKKIVIKPSGGKDAKTHFRVARRYRKASLLEVRPKTGRTHQIRVHMAHLGHPVLGDLLYGVASPWIDRQALHAAVLEFRHPTTLQRISFKSPLPDDMERLLGALAQE
ncbi:MAG: RluA family pseudouridine synthase [Candidatus Omnitrophota bacterium]